MNTIPTQNQLGPTPPVTRTMNIDQMRTLAEAIKLNDDSAISRILNLSTQMQANFFNSSEAQEILLTGVLDGSITNDEITKRVANSNPNIDANSQLQILTELINAGHENNMQNGEFKQNILRNFFPTR